MLSLTTRELKSDGTARFSGRGKLAPGFTGQYEVTAGSTSDPLQIHPLPTGKEQITVTAIPNKELDINGKPITSGSSGTANVQHTTSPDAAVEAGNAIWINWAEGAVSSDTTDRLLGPITALRFTATTQNAIFEVVI